MAFVPRRISGAGWLLLLLVLVGCAVGGFVVGRNSVSPRQTSSGTAVGRTQIKQSLALVRRFASPAGYPFALSLAQSLGLADPGIKYRVLAFPAATPPVGAVGVYSTGQSVWLRAQGAGSTVIEGRAVGGGRAATNYGPYVVSDLSASDGNFTTPLKGVWTVQAGPSAAIKLDRAVYQSPPASLRVIGTGKGGPATTVTQQISSAMPRGTRYSLACEAKTVRLSRPLLVELRLQYDNGSYQFFEAQSPDLGVVGIPAGTSKGWVPLQLTAVATRPVKSAVVFAVDTGATPLRGTAWIDNIAAAQG